MLNEKQIEIFKEYIVLLFNDDKMLPIIENLYQHSKTNESCKKDFTELINQSIDEMINIVLDEFNLTNISLQTLTECLNHLKEFKNEQK